MQLFNKTIIIILSACASFGSASAQMRGVDVVKVPESKTPYKGESITIPDVNGYNSLKCDFHVHTVFSDGEIKPQNRVWEALGRGLDVMAITDHLEYTPNFVTQDRNEPYNMAKELAANNGLLLVHGAEITRSKPFGHMNALFITDANKLLCDDPLEVVANAIEQGAFMMWNHPGWPDDNTAIFDVQKKLIAQNRIHGVELVNGFEYYPKAFNYCKDYNLTYMGCSDIHGVYAQSYRTDEQSGPITIVFAKERTLDGVKEALFDRRTVVKFRELLIGSEQYLKALAKACLSYELLDKKDGKYKAQVKNNSSLIFVLEFDGKIVPIGANASEEVVVGQKSKILFKNAYITDDTQLVIDVQSLR